jgi:hypothetical protein
VVVPAVAAASAAADNPLEGVWSFNGGEVAIVSQTDGTMAGTVVKTTTFDECPHRAGERIWSGITQQPDGSYWGLHQWFFLGSGCIPNPKLGDTAWRVMTAGTGRFLRVCLSEPGKAQPTIAADGTPTGASFGCLDSALSTRTVADVCVLGNTIRVPVRVRRDNPLAKISIVLAGGHIKRIARFRPHKKSFTAVVKVGKITAPTVRATTKLTTVSGKHLRQQRVYRRCG